MLIPLSCDSILWYGLNVRNGWPSAQRFQQHHTFVSPQHVLTQLVVWNTSNLALVF